MFSSIKTAEEAILTLQEWGFPVPIAYGPGRLAEIGTRCNGMGLANPLVVTDAGSRDLPFIARLVTYLEAAGLKTAVFSGISPNPRDDEIGAGRRMFREGGHDAVIAIGGGSGMDGGKAVCLTANNDIDLWAFEYEQSPPAIAKGQPFPTLICIPTTAGTGAETESTAMVTHLGKQMKFCVWHPTLKPALALLDPELTLGLPPRLTAWTGADALTHAIEAYSVPGLSPLCDGIALEGLRLIARWLPIAVREPANLQARGGLLLGSCLGGIAFLKGLGLVHAIAHVVGAEYNTHHGLTNAVLLPHVLRYNLPALPEKIAPMAQAMGLEATDGAALLAAVERLLADIGIPQDAASVRVPADSIGRLSRKSMLDSAFATNPRVATMEDLNRILTEALVQQPHPTG
ncbi:MAG: iron-containing alcohol dehydrogenase [Paracoccaceae bacterium]